MLPKVGLRRTVEDAGPYIVSICLIVGNGFIRSAIPAHGGRTHRCAPTINQSSFAVGAFCERPQNLPLMRIAPHKMGRRHEE